MSRAMYDLQQLQKTNFDHTNVTYGHGGTAADPTIEIEEIFLRNDATHNINGRVMFTDEQRGANIDLGEFIHKRFLISGRIEYTNVGTLDGGTDGYDDKVIKQILDELESVTNVNNNNISRTYSHILLSSDWNNDLVNPQIEFLYETTETDVSATT